MLVHNLSITNGWSLQLEKNYYHSRCSFKLLSHHLVAHSRLLSFPVWAKELNN